MDRNLLIGTLVLVAGCVSAPLRQGTPAAPRSVRVKFLYQSNRLASLEPCGCHSKPYGGVDREANAIEASRSEEGINFYVEAGNTLAPKSLPGIQERHREKARLIADVLGRMGLEVFTPGPSDFQLGTEFLQALARTTPFSWVATNVTKESRLVFPAFHLVAKEGVRFAFLSANAPIPGLTVEDPATSLRRSVTELQGRADFIVVLSQLGARENEALAKKTPEIALIIGSDEALALEEPAWLSGHTLLVDPHVYGYFLGVLSVELALPFRGFYSPSAIATNRRKLGEWKGKLSQDPTNTVAQRLVEHIEKSECLNPIPGGSTYKNALIALDKKQYGARNAITILLEKAKAKNRASALEELGD